MVEYVEHSNRLQIFQICIFQSLRTTSCQSLVRSANGKYYEHFYRPICLYAFYDSIVAVNACMLSGDPIQNYYDPRFALPLYNTYR